MNPVTRLNPFPHRSRLPALALVLALILALAISVLPAVAAPGAHGPNGEHLDEKSTAAATTGASAPRLEAHTEQFELVATLYDSELSILVDRYASNEPVLGAKLEIEVGGVTALAPFRADHGDYTSTDPQLLQLLKTPGQHALVFTLTAGPDSDLLDGTLGTAGGDAAAAHDHAHATGAAHDHDDDHDQGLGLLRSKRFWAATGLAGLALLGGAWWWRRRTAAAGSLGIGRQA